MRFIPFYLFDKFMLGLFLPAELSLALVSSGAERSAGATLPGIFTLFPAEDPEQEDFLTRDVSEHSATATPDRF